MKSNGLVAASGGAERDDLREAVQEKPPCEGSAKFCRPAERTNAVKQDAKEVLLWKLFSP